jgi:hypothetical protein
VLQNLKTVKFGKEKVSNICRISSKWNIESFTTGPAAGSFLCWKIIIHISSKWNFIQVKYSFLRHFYVVFFCRKITNKSLNFFCSQIFMIFFVIQPRPKTMFWAFKKSPYFVRIFMLFLRILFCWRKNVDDNIPNSDKIIIQSNFFLSRRNKNSAKLEVAKKYKN